MLSELRRLACVHLDRVISAAARELHSGEQPAARCLVRALDGDGDGDGRGAPVALDGPGQGAPVALDGNAVPDRHASGLGTESPRASGLGTESPRAVPDGHAVLDQDGAPLLEPGEDGLLATP
jgi:hypothetical protein